MQEKNVLEELKIINANIRQKQFSPFYFLYGEEDFFITSIKSNVEKYFEDSSGLNKKVYYDDNFDVKEVSKYIISAPILSDKKLIIFNNIEFFKEVKNENAIKNILEALETSKEINVVLIINVDVDKRGDYKKKEKRITQYSKKNPIVTYISKNGVLFNSKILDDASISKYLVSYFEKRNKHINNFEIAYIVKNCGKKLNNLFSEADKIIAYMGNEVEVTHKIIDECVTRNIDDNVFKLIDLINANRKNEAYMIYGDLLSIGIDEHAIFANFTSTYEKMIMIKDMTMRNISMKEIATTMNLSDWVVRKYIDVNKSISLDGLNEKIKLITKLSMDSMKNIVSPRLMLELLFNK